MIVRITKAEAVITTLYSTVLDLKGRLRVFYCFYLFLLLIDSNAATANISIYNNKIKGADVLVSKDNNTRIRGLKEPDQALSYFNRV